MTLTQFQALHPPIVIVHTPSRSYPWIVLERELGAKPIEYSESDGFDSLRQAVEAYPGVPVVRQS